MADYPIATHHAGYTVRNTVVKGTNTGSTSITVGMVVWNDGAGATANTLKFGRTGVTGSWAPANESAAADVRAGTFGIAMTAAAAGAEVSVCIAGFMVPALLETAGDATLTPHQALYIDVADDELVTTRIKQTVRFRSSIQQAVVGAAVHTVYVDVEGVSGFGYDDAV